MHLLKPSTWVREQSNKKSSIISFLPGLVWLDGCVVLSTPPDWQHLTFPKALNNKCILATKATPFKSWQTVAFYCKEALEPKRKINQTHIFWLSVLGLRKLDCQKAGTVYKKSTVALETNSNKTYLQSYIHYNKPTQTHTRGAQWRFKDR